MIILNTQFSFNPLIIVNNNQKLVTKILPTLEKFIHLFPQKSMHNGELLQTFPVSGLAKQQHTLLQNFLFDQHLLGSYVIKGHFANPTQTHFWLRINDLLIDLNFGQFKNKNLEISPLLNEYFERQIFVCDQPQNLIYRLYHHG